jgi:hypothetical protein
MLPIFMIGNIFWELFKSISTCIFVFNIHEDFQNEKLDDFLINEESN